MFQLIERLKKALSSEQPEELQNAYDNTYPILAGRVEAEVKSKRKACAQSALFLELTGCFTSPSAKGRKSRARLLK